MNFAQHSPRALKMFLYRFGEEVSVYNDADVQKDALNHSFPTAPSDWSEIGKTLCMPHHGGSNTTEEEDYDSGFRSARNVAFIFPPDSVIQEDTHIVFDGEEYEVTGLQERGTHIKAMGKKQNEGAVLG